MSEIKTCEEYVLAELEEWKDRALAAESDKNAIKMLQDIFIVTLDKVNKAIKIGIKEGALDGKNPGAAARIMLLRGLFEEKVSEANEASVASEPLTEEEKLRRAEASAAEIKKAYGLDRL